MSNTSHGQFNKFASVSIQGGGVYGLNLIGQLQGVIDKGFVIVGLSGTSAGAIVSALHWAGMSPKEIRDWFAELAEPEAGKLGILELLGGSTRTKDYVTKNMGRIAAVKSNLNTLFASPPKPTATDKKTSRLKNIGRWLGKCATFPIRMSKTILAPAMVLYRGTSIYRSAKSNAGLFPGDVFEEQIDKKIKNSIIQSIRRKNPDETIPDILNANALLTFGDAWKLMEKKLVVFPALTLTATNMSTQQLELFDSTDPRFFDVPIAKAVRASGGFPLFFKPTPIELPDIDDPSIRRTCHYADGGIILNFPGFVFSKSLVRAAFRRMPDIYGAFAMRPWMNVGLRLIDPAVDPPKVGEVPKPTPNGMLGSLVGLLSGGTRSVLETKLAEVSVERPVTVGQRRDESTPESNEAATGWRHGLLDFDRLTKTSVRRMFLKGRAVACLELKNWNFDLPVPEDIEPEMKELVDLAAVALGDQKNRRVKVRSTLFVPKSTKLELLYRANMDDPILDTDRDLVLGFDQGVVGYSYTQQRPVICNFELLTASDIAERLYGMRSLFSGRVRRDRTWLITMPILDPDTADPYVHDRERAKLENPESKGTNQPRSERSGFGRLPIVANYHADLHPPFGGACFGVLCLDAAIDYGKIDLKKRASDQQADPRIELIFSALMSKSWKIGKTFAAYYGYDHRQDREDGS